MSLADLLAEEPVDHYAYDVPFEHVPDVPLVTFHSSGTSGDPKPINWSRSFISTLDCGHCLPAGQGIPVLESLNQLQNLLVVLPQFHAFGLGFAVFAAFYEMTIVLGHPDVWFSPEHISGLLQLGQVTSFFGPPSLLEDVSKMPQGIEGLSALEHVCYAGGPSRPDVGDSLAPKLKHLHAQLGATEWGYAHLACGPSKCWSAMKFFQDVGYRFDKVAENIFEIVMVNDPMTNKYHGTFEVFPQLKEYRTKDLWSPVPDLPSGWLRYQGRANDLMALSNGEKVNSIPMENTIQAHPIIKAALIIGQYRFNPSLLMQTEDDCVPQNQLQSEAILHQIWPTIQEANSKAPGFAKIPKSLVLFARPDKPFLLAGKGTVQRQNTIKLYAAELDELYHSAEMGVLVEGLTIEKPVNLLGPLKIAGECTIPSSRNSITDFER
ncbi:hypothetical protein BP5796_00114 [Coleophoma crateriformis]|uniref:AMP-dependent synthetase/ligase domain-containing protein n=1 Tax=Coleophoma crateriformis TaxID=565419 RepID=A0A3D8T7D8_9HELO|nr:hypothetical protein BP5796_00114 [Coleophoma crateriformis]